MAKPIGALTATRKMPQLPDYIPLVDSDPRPAPKRRPPTPPPPPPPPPPSYQPQLKKTIIFGDAKLYDRLYEVVNNGTFEDIDSIIKQLFQKYPEYRRTKRNVFKRSVTKGIELLRKELNIPDRPEPASPINHYNEPPVHNHVNNSINAMYSKNGSHNNQNQNNQKRKLKQQQPDHSKNNKHFRPNEKLDHDIQDELMKIVNLQQKYLVRPTVSFWDFGGVDDVIQDIRRLVFHIRNAQLYRELGVDAPRGFLLHGPPGVGKSLLVEALANDLQIAYLKCAATEIVAGISGESEEKLRQLFALAKSLRPCLLFIDEIDAITPKRENASKEMERRIVTQLISCIDELSSSDGSGDGVMVIGATNRPDALDPALRRAGRFDREIALGIPDEKARIHILRVLFRGIKVPYDFDFGSLAHRTPGYVGADLKSLIREAAILALERFLRENHINDNDTVTLQSCSGHQDFLIKPIDFDAALKKVQPSSKREGFATVPDVTWNDVGALAYIRKELQMSILAPVRFSSDVQRLGLSLSVGILLAGPPGCGKTLLAKAIANESGINFISVKGPELLNMYVGESERAVRAVFNRARVSKPCVIFFDEIDALCPRRTNDDSSNVTSRVVNQLLTEMDGLESRECFLLAATNRPDILDPAILRPGRFDKILHVGFPTAEDRYEILWTITRQGTRPPIDPTVHLEQLARDKRLEGFTGADLASLVREASLVALREKIEGQLPAHKEIILGQTHFDLALDRVKPSVSAADRARYEKMISTG